MQTIERETEPCHFEVILYFEGNSWLFWTFAKAGRMREALERAEKEFTAHSSLHKLSRYGADSAYVIDGCDSCYFAKRDGRWQLAQSPSGSRPALFRRNLPQPLGETEGVGAMCP